MSDLIQLFNQAIACHQTGKIPEAISLYLKILPMQRDNDELLFTIGTAYCQIGRLEDGLSYLKKSLVINPSNFHAHSNIGTLLIDLGRPDEAIQSFNGALALNPNFPEALLGRGNALMKVGRLEEAIKNYDNALILVPNYAAAYLNKGKVLQDLHKLEDALTAYGKAIALAPDFAEAYSNRANVLKDLGLPEQALSDYNKAIQFNPNLEGAYTNRGCVLETLKRFDEAIASHDKAVALKPGYAEAFSNRGNVLLALNRFDEALANQDRAIALKPDLAAAHFNRGILLHKLKIYDEALASYSKAIDLRPAYPDAYAIQADALYEIKRYEEADVCYVKALELEPDSDFLYGMSLLSRAHLCKWDKFDESLTVLSEVTSNRKKISSPFPLLALTDSPEMHKLASEIFVESKYPKAEAWPNFTLPTKDLKIRIGYFSADFHDHATMHLMAELFEKHDKERFDLVALSFGPVTNDEWQTRARNVFDTFIDCHQQSDAAIARLSRELGVDIAVDLKGFTQESRTGIFAAGAAPIQVNFLGYPGTMGADYIDYLVADELLIPERYRHFYTEKIAYMPDCYQPNCRSRDIANTPISRSDFGLPETGVVLGSFNNNYKITPEIFRSWVRILKEVEGSVLWLLASNPIAERNLRRRLEENGIDPDRLIVAQRVSVEAHLNRMHLADLMLDTFPYGAHTTCSDALRVGLPVVTIEGESFASRVAASILTTVGLPELVTDSHASYENLIIALAKDPERLSEIRRRLENNIKLSSLFAPELFARNLELLYVSMHQRRLDGLQPDHISIQ